MTVAAVTLWGREIGAVSIGDRERYASFQYDPAFVRSGIEVAPVHMPLREAPYRFPGLPEDAFRGLPGLLADALPDRWGNALIDDWLAAQGRRRSSFDVVERLCYVGTRAMGALSFEPATGPAGASSGDLEIAELVRLASEALSEKKAFVAELSSRPAETEMKALLAIGTSAGGARPKAIIAYNKDTRQVRSGQLDATPGFQQWLLKFDGVRGAGDRGLLDPLGFGVIEYTYYELATAAGITMTECRLLEENDRRHFMTRRFDRPDDGSRLHVQTLAALEHISYNEPGTYSYEQAFALMRRLGLRTPAIEQQFRRMVFNVIARNQDDHVKNISFVMDPTGKWSLSPAYDITWSCDPGNEWFHSHQMSLNGKRDDFTREDIQTVGRNAGLVRGRAKAIFDEISDVVATWPERAAANAVDPVQAQEIAASHRLTLPAR